MEHDGNNLFQNAEYTQISWYENKKCIFCKHTYQEFNNLGHWKCRYHPAPHYDGVYLCCGAMGTHVAGCVPCDHHQYGTNNVLFRSNFAKLRQSDFKAIVVNEYGNIMEGFKMDSIFESGYDTNKSNDDSIENCDPMDDSAYFGIANDLVAAHERAQRNLQLSPYIVISRFKDMERWFDPCYRLVVEGKCINIFIIFLFIVSIVRNDKQFVICPDRLVLKKDTQKKNHVMTSDYKIIVAFLFCDIVQTVIFWYSQHIQFYLGLALFSILCLLQEIVRWTFIIPDTTATITEYTIFLNTIVIVSTLTIILLQYLYTIRHTHKIKNLAAQRDSYETRQQLTSFTNSNYTFYASAKPDVKTSLPSSRTYRHADHAMGLMNTILFLFFRLVCVMLLILLEIPLRPWNAVIYGVLCLIGDTFYYAHFDLSSKLPHEMHMYHLDIILYIVLLIIRIAFLILAYSITSLNARLWFILCPVSMCLLGLILLYPVSLFLHWYQGRDTNHDTNHTRSDSSHWNMCK